MKSQSDVGVEEEDGTRFQSSKKKVVFKIASVVSMPKMVSDFKTEAVNMV